MATPTIPSYDPNYRPPAQPSLLRRIGNNLSQDAVELRRAFRSPDAAEDAIGAALAPSIGGTGLRNAVAIGQGLRGAAAVPLSAQAGLAASAAAPAGTALAGAAVPTALMARNEALADAGAPTAAESGVIINPSVGQLSSRGALRQPVAAIVNPDADLVPTLRRRGPSEVPAAAVAPAAPQVAVPDPVRAAQVRGNQGAIIRNPDAASLTDRIAMASSAFKGSPSMRRAITEALVGEAQGQNNAYEASLNRNAAAEATNAQAQNAVATANADRALRGGTTNAELQLRDTERRDTQDYRGADLKLRARAQLAAERAAANTSATAINKRYDELAADFMARNPGATYEQAADFAGNAARVQGVGANSTLIGRGSNAIEGERLSELAGQAGRGVNPDRSVFNPVGALYDGAPRAAIENRLAGLSNGQLRSITTDPGNFTPRRQSLRELAVAALPGGMSPGDVVWEDSAAGNAFSATPESLRGMTLEQWRNRYGRP